MVHVLGSRVVDVTDSAIPLKLVKIMNIRGKRKM
jgi:hypothetical protein